MKHVTLKMKKTVKGSPDGITARDYKEGETYEVPEALARVFTDVMKCAVAVKTAQPAKATQEK
jgi:hypothetical protein